MDKTILLSVVGLLLSAVTIFAIYYGPISALKIQRNLDEDRGARDRKLYIFKTLMSNRATRMSPLYVQALNLIDVEFTANNDKEKAVRDAWKELLDVYSNYKTMPNALEKVDDLTAAMLAMMGKTLGYDFDKVYLKKGAYYPEGSFNVEQEQHALRKRVLELLDGTGTRKLPIAVFEQRFPDLIDQPKARAAGEPEEEV
jgi:uncharacterized protein DUF6680